jgi:hypothetical protein
MRLTKATLQTAVYEAAQARGVPECGRLALAVLQSGAFELDSPPAPPGRFTEWVVIGSNSLQGTRTAGRHVNVFALLGVIMTALTTPMTPSSAVGLAVAVCGACTVNLSPDQAAFFAALHDAEQSEQKPSVNRMVEYMAAALKDRSYDRSEFFETAKELRRLGVRIEIGDPPTERIRCIEGRWVLPGL